MQRLLVMGSRGPSRRDQFIAQLPIFAGVAICTALMPRYLFSTDMGGVSNYGVFARTSVMYSAGVVLTSLLQWRATSPVETPRQVRASAKIVSLGLLANLATTYRYHHGGLWEATHTTTAIALALLEVALGFHLAIRLARGPARAGSLGLLLTGFVGLALTYFGALHVLFVAELLTGVGFATALVAAMPSDAVRSTRSALRPTPTRGEDARGLGIR